MSKILCFLEELAVTKILYMQLVCTLVHVLYNYFSNNKISFFNVDFQIALLGQLTSTNSCLLMHSILVRINALKRNFGKQKSI